MSKHENDGKGQNEDRALARLLQDTLRKPPLKNSAKKHPLVEVFVGSSALVLGAPHGGKEMPQEYLFPNKTSFGFMPGDLYTDEMVRFLVAHSKGALAGVVARGSRGLLDLNTYAHYPSNKLLQGYYNAYHNSLENQLKAAGKKYGVALFVDIHGYRDDSLGYEEFLREKWPTAQESQEAANDEETNFYFGTGYGKFVPVPFSAPYFQFQADLDKAGFTVCPFKSFLEQPNFFGGPSLNIHAKPNSYPWPVLAIQIEVPLSVRRDQVKREVFLVVLGRALLKLNNRVVEIAGGIPSKMELPTSFSRKNPEEKIGEYTHSSAPDEILGQRYW